MNPLPATTVLSNIATWAITDDRLPAVVAAMLSTPTLTFERYDLGFRGQRLETTYFDSKDFALRSARKQGDNYLTLRVRCYQSADQGEAYALAAKTESEKWRMELTDAQAEELLDESASIAALLPSNLLARLMELAPQGVQPIVKVCCRRYAVEDDSQRLTLDTLVRTSTGKSLPASILEFKATDRDQASPAPIEALRLSHIKLSKFMWATNWR
jgi:hypothetical protein